MTFAAFQKVDHQIPRDAVEPTSEGSPLFVRLPAFDRIGNSEQDLLSNVHRITVLEALAASQPEHQRLVDLSELLPRGEIRSIPKSQDQTGSGFGRVPHVLARCVLVV